MVCEAVEEYAKRKADEVAKKVARETSVKTTIEDAVSYGMSKEQIIKRVTEKYGIDEEEAETLYNLAQNP